ncbi:hypothetical protein [Geodermatophilus sp. CPCC 205761]|uniref:hypothetical protein n=1 Tax=Geodermatophilus sp. CPCC 205761 TaxID=2936597 RepID=UPI003EE9028C
MRSSAWQRLFPDVYACSTVELTHRVRTVAVVRLLFPGAVASGRSAACWWGADVAGPDDAVDCTVPPGAHHGVVAGVRLRRRHLAADDVIPWKGLTVTGPLRTVLDLAALRPPDEAVVAVDQFLQLERVSLADAREAGRRSTGRDCRLVRTALSPPTASRSRLGRPGCGSCCTVPGSPVPSRIAVEYDGTWHGDPQQVGKDRRRLNRLTAAGRRVVFVTAADLHRPDEVVARAHVLLTTPTSA